MAFQRLRRAVLAASASTALLASCGGGNVVDQLTPTGIVSFGDATADVGQNSGGKQYTVNDTTAFTNWTQEMAARYGLAITSAQSGGRGYAVGNARIVAKPDVAGNSATPTVADQITAYLATGKGFADSDIEVVSAGISDIVVQGLASFNGSQTQAQGEANVRQAGRDLGAQIRRLVQSGARHVVVTGAYNLGRTPWGQSTGKADVLTDWSTKFNEEMLVSIVDLGANVLYVDRAFYYNLVTSSPGSYAIDNVLDIACTSVDPGPGIGIGAGKVNSSLCTTATLDGSLDYNRTFYADALYPAPVAQRLFGDYAYDRVRGRF